MTVVPNDVPEGMAQIVAEYNVADTIIVEQDVTAECIAGVIAIIGMGYTGVVPFTDPTGKTGKVRITVRPVEDTTPNPVH